MIKRLVLIVAVATSLSACAAGPGLGGNIFRLAEEGREYKVGSDRLAVTPPRAWNRLGTRRLFTDVREVEDWTLNGPYLDTLSFVSGLKDGRAIVYQRKRDIRQVPKFDARMTPPEIASMLESYYRARGGALQFEQTGLKPRQFLGHPGFQFDFDYLGGDELWRRGRAVGAIVEGRLYLILLEGTRQHYFDEALPDFEAMVQSARLT
ncbi:hypothetical protein [Sphingomicrobium lutaoense]|uniref:Lipoprotein n=1 Tax=Sphingomicrobium lutaoense TaxID=515949 RepID=A0A839Z1L2_9SPHN|nr:hypothetical protein [Sphingomicrobium lutaoense]MBB3763562.1 hypothetical protein [Sphingomicrobium lutaoense]